MSEQTQDVVSEELESSTNEIEQQIDANAPETDIVEHEEVEQEGTEEAVQETVQEDSEAVQKRRVRLF